MDIVVCAITSRPPNGDFDIPVSPTIENGLRVPSTVQFDKLATLERSIIWGRLGSIPQGFLEEHRNLFISVFGFDKTRLPSVT